jgi:hypothetical protein
MLCDIGSYSQCRHCRMPLGAEDSTPGDPAFLPGVHCKHCVHSLTDKKRAGLEERNKQIKLAAEQNVNHLGLQLTDIKAKRSVKRKKSRPATECKEWESGSLIVVTRVHCKSASSMVKVEDIVEFAQHCHFADKILILLGVGPKHTDYPEKLVRTLHNTLSFSSPELLAKVRVEVVSPWVGFTIPLNVAVRLALDSGYDYILFQVSH